MILYYYFISPLGFFLLRALGFLSPNIRIFLKTRVGLLERWRNAKLGKNRIWFHVSSVGELEQIRPVLERLAKEKKYSLVISYYSISVPRLVKDWSFAAYADYLPLDKRSDMRELMAIINPMLLVLNRYDLWPNHLWAAKEAKVPIALVNASTPPLGFLGSLSLFFRRVLFGSIDYWTYVDPEAALAWEPFVRPEVKGLVAGNPRVDRAIERVESALAKGVLKENLNFWQRDPKIVAGSTWPKDELVLLDVYLSLQKKYPQLGFVLVPHEPEEAHLLELEQQLKNKGLTSLRLSKLHSQTEVNFLIVDGRGFLAELYGIAKVAYVGGGFGREVHSIIEPLAHGLPVAFGPNHHRSPEADALLSIGAAYVVSSEAGLVDWFTSMLENCDENTRAREALRIYLGMHRGAGERIGDFLLGCLENSIMLPK